MATFALVLLLKIAGATDAYVIDQHMSADDCRAAVAAHPSLTIEGATVPLTCEAEG